MKLPVRHNVAQRCVRAGKAAEGVVVDVQEQYLAEDVSGTLDDCDDCGQPRIDELWLIYYGGSPK